MILLRHPDTRCELAMQDRNLLREADDREGTAGAMLETMYALYPGRIAADGRRANSLHN